MPYRLAWFHVLMATQEAPLSIVPALQCNSLNGWYPARIASASDPDRQYVVHVNPWANRSEQHVCECKSYQYRGHCKHQKEAHLNHCGWNAIEGPEEPLVDPAEGVLKECPRCHGPATWAMWEEV